METIPGLFSGQIAMSMFGIIAVGDPENTGDSTISRIAAPSPPYMLHTAPRVLKRRQNSE